MHKYNMASRSEILLSNQAHSGDSSTLTVTGEKLPGDGYYGRSDGLHTIQYGVNQFSGTIRIQATLAVNPSSDDWFTVLLFSLNEQTENNISSFTGNYVWIRAILEYTAGSVDSIILNH